MAEVFWDGQPVIVLWTDSYQTHGWADLEGYLKDDHTGGHCRSVGWVVEDSEEWLGLTEGWSGKTCINGILRIPKIALKSIVALREVP